MTRNVTVLNRNGLHARPSSVLAEAALKFSRTSITLRKGEMNVDAKSIMELLLLEAAHGTELVMSASGPEADEAIEALTALFLREFDIKL
ncbi:MAG: HPr family phosphocarrier protein [Planctomycetota bacterium]